MRVPKPKLRTNSLSQESKFIYFAFLTDKTGKRTAVIIPINEWTNICESIVELDKHEAFKTNLQSAFKEMIEIEKGKGEEVTLNEFIDEL